MKKLICALLAVCLLLALAACGGGGEPSGEPGGEPSGEPTGGEAGGVAGEVYDTGTFHVLVADGWKAFPQHDVFSDDPEAMNPNLLQIAKGASSDLDLFSKPLITVSYAGASTTLMAPYRDFYEDVEDMGTVSTGEHTWEAFRCTSYGQKMVILYEDLGDIQYQVSVAYETSDGSIDFEDADVQAIVDSVMTSETAAE